MKENEQKIWAIAGNDAKLPKESYDREFSQPEEFKQQNFRKNRIDLHEYILPILPELRLVC